MSRRKHVALSAFAIFITFLLLTSCEPSITIGTITPQPETSKTIQPTESSIPTLEIKTPVSLIFPATIEPTVPPDPGGFDRGVILLNTNPGLGAVLPGNEDIEIISNDCFYRHGAASDRRAAVLLGKNSSETCTSYDHVYYDLGLYTVSLPDLELTEITPLTPNFGMITEGTHYSEIPPEVFHATTAIAWTAPEWSPDGRYLAFVGAIEGPSSDLYIYDSLDDTIARRSFGSNQAMELSWAPNSAGVLHTEYEFSVNPYDVFVYLPVALWWAPIDGSPLMKISNMADPIFWGWVTDTRFMIWNTSPGGRIEIGDVSTGNAQAVLESVDRAITLYSADGGSILAGVDNGQNDLDVYLIDGESGEVSQLELTIDGAYFDMVAVPAMNRFLVADINNGLLWITTNGQILSIDGDITPSDLTLSPDVLKVVASGSQMSDVRLYEFDPDGRIVGKFSIQAWNDSWWEPIWHPLSSALLLDCDTQAAEYALPEEWEEYRFIDRSGCPHWANAKVIIWFDE